MMKNKNKARRIPTSEEKVFWDREFDRYMGFGPQNDAKTAALIADQALAARRKSLG